MRAQTGDHRVVPGRHVGDSARHGEVIEVKGPNGTPPFLVRWHDGHEGVFFPGPECRVVHPA